MSKIYVVGTPIGNLSDITIRALEILKNVPIIACEDTRVTQKLLDKYQIIGKKLITYNAFTEETTSLKIIDYVLHKNQDVAIVSDAGMPCVSDPGFEIIKLARMQNIELEIIPGVSAVITGFVGAAFSNTFSFLGFVKDKSEQRKKEFKQQIINENHSYIYYVSPHKLLDCLNDIYEVFDDNIKICLVKELTKIHETWYFDSVSNLINIFMKKPSIKGEFTLCLMKPKLKHQKKNKYQEFSKVN